MVSIQLFHQLDSIREISCVASLNMSPMVFAVHGEPCPPTMEGILRPDWPFGEWPSAKVILTNSFSWKNSTGCLKNGLSHGLRSLFLSLSLYIYIYTYRDG